MPGLLNKQQACKYLGAGEEELDRLVQEGRITAYKLGGMYVRFKQAELDRIKASIRPISSSTQQHKAGIFERFLDFLYYNVFYIFVIVIILLLLAILFRISL